MAKADLDALYRLHKIDAAILEIRRRAASLDAGQSARKRIEAFQPEYDALAGAARKAESELKDAELQRQTRAGKIKKIDQEIYGGKVVNPREIEAMQKELANLRAQQDEAEMRELEMMEELPELQDRARKAEEEMARLRRLLAAKRQEALGVKAELEAAFMTAQAARGPSAKAVPPPLLAQYEAILKRAGGVAMAEVTEDGTCARCRTKLPTKTVLEAKASRWVTCEECHRILIWVQAP
jgi:predicted  nucleic acid-binding Zn-ribbon protein